MPIQELSKSILNLASHTINLHYNYLYFKAYWSIVDTIEVSTLLFTIIYSIYFVVTKIHEEFDKSI